MRGARRAARPRSPTRTTSHGKYAQASGARVDFGRCFEIARRSGQARHVCCVPTPSQAAYGCGDAYDQLVRSVDGAPAFAGADAKSVKRLAKLTGWSVLARSDVADDDDCCVCMCALFDDDDDDLGSPDDVPVRLSRCKGHAFHRDCVVACAGGDAKDWMQCPVCMAIYGVRTGPMPNGTMKVSRTKTPLAGHTGGTITINYKFPNGTQDARHPSPGTPYTGTSRTAYLPDNKEGNQVLKVGWAASTLLTLLVAV